jgi:hypothetical protein
MDETRMGGVDGIMAEFSLLQLPSVFVSVVVGVGTIIVT